MAANSVRNDQARASRISNSASHNARASPGQWLNRNYELDHLPPHRHRHRSSTDMDSRNPFSRGFKKLKHKLMGGNRKRGGRSGNENDQGGREADVEASEASQRSSRLHPEVEGVESGSSREGNDVDGNEVGRFDPPTSTHSISHSEDPNST